MGADSVVRVLDLSTLPRLQVSKLASKHHRGNDDWQVELIYFALPSVEMSKLRVAERVAHGGHNIQLQDIKRRFPRSLNNLLNIFSQTVDRCVCFMNDGEDPVLVFEQDGEYRDIIDEFYYNLMLQEAGS